MLCKHLLGPLSITLGCFVIVCADAYAFSTGLPIHTSNVFHTSALLTSIVLPERADSGSQPVVLLEADGSFSPAPLNLGLQRRSAYRVNTPRR